MNQILSIETPKKEKKSRNRSPRGPVEIEKIVKFFVIAILVFGVLMVGSGSYSMYKEAQTKSNALPEINVADISENEINLQVTHNKGLSTVTYRWNDEEPIEINADGNKSVVQKIEIPTGENTLNISAIDVNGGEAKYQRLYNLLGDINIELSAVGNNIEISVTGKEKISYITYRWDEDEEIQIDINSTQATETVEIPRGLHTLTVIAVDINNNTEAKEQKVNGVTKPKLEVTSDDDGNLVIKTSDEEGVKKVEFTINGQSYKLDLDQVFELDDRKEFEYKYPLDDGNNKVQVKVYNESGVSETIEEEFDK